MEIDIEKIKNSSELALLLGMFAGDGCLPISHNGGGYRIYPIRFYNTNKKYVNLFRDLFYKVFKSRGTIRNRKRKNRLLLLWEFEKYSVFLYKLINEDLEIVSGKKAKFVGIPSFILGGSEELKKHFFLGLLITDGGIRKNGTIIFHSASKRLLLDLKKLMKDVWNIDKELKSYIQKEKYFSYQLDLNKTESSNLLHTMPRSHNLVLR